MTDREKKFNKIWTHAHADYKSKSVAYGKSLLSHAKYNNGGTCLVNLNSISDLELEERYAATLNRLSKKAEG